MQVMWAPRLTIFEQARLMLAAGRASVPSSLLSARWILSDPQA